MICKVKFRRCFDETIVMRFSNDLAYCCFCSSFPAAKFKFRACLTTSFSLTGVRGTRKKTERKDDMEGM